MAGVGLARFGLAGGVRDGGGVLDDKLGREGDLVLGDDGSEGFVRRESEGGERLVDFIVGGAAPARGGVAVVAAVASGVFKRLLTLFSSDDISVNTRSQIWKACFEMLDGHLLFGYGTGVNNVREQLHETYGIMQPHAHNIFLQITLENGIIGLAIFLGACIVFGISMIKLAHCGKKERGVAVTLTACLVAFCACGMTDHLLYGLKPVCYMMMLFGMGSAAVRIYRKKANDKKDEV